MSLIEKLYTLIIFLSVMFGLIIGQAEIIRTHAAVLIVPLLTSMLYITFLQIPLENIKRAFKNLRFTYTSVIINFVWTPLFAWFLASLFLGDNEALYIGFIMLMVTPCTDWYLVFTGIARGNVALSTAVLPLNFVLQVILLPAYLLVFGGASGIIELEFLIESILLVLVLPFLLASLTKASFRNRERIQEKILYRLSAFPILFLSLAIAAMFASQGQLLLENLELMGQIAIPILVFFAINFIISQKVGQLMKFPYEDRASLSLTTLARNSPIALAIAMTAFPDQPLIALTLVIGPLLELPILAVITQLLLVRSKNVKSTHP
ncbi:bile acid:sodium symporter [Bacillus sp. FJAT-27251]|uniref:arsenic resistance protein n=1 Tax=Bacillus sp. FJAT-27251 TaxID=1684142 RepID=UPI0006A7E55D|nr:bile acid:sodium symporter [Bacillus sp. FJAT-27251]